MRANYQVKTSLFTSFKDRLKDLYWSFDNKGCRILLERHKKPFSNENVNFTDNRVNEVYQRDNQRWDHEEIIAEVQHVLVEPDFGYAIKGYRTIIGLSKRKGRFGIPSPIPVIKAKLRKPKFIIEKAILFDGSLGTNYFYFHAVLLSKIQLLQEHYNLKALPVLVGKRTFERAYFQDMIKLKAFSEINWTMVSDAVNVKNLVLCVPSYYEKLRLSNTKKLVLGERKAADKVRKIFVDRTNRRISNFEAIEPVLKKHGFEVVNPVNLNLTDQAALFNEASHVIGIHGAGLANLVFSRPDYTKVLEIAPSVLLHTHYYWLSRTMDMPYDIMVGEASAGVYDDFQVDVNVLEKKIIDLLSN